MPDSERWRIKRRLDQSIDKIVSGQHYLVEEAQLYKDVHPDIYKQFSDIVIALDLCVSTIQNLRDSI
jgi:hypothetical protein